MRFIGEPRDYRSPFQFSSDSYGLSSDAMSLTPERFFSPGDHGYHDMETLRLARRKAAIMAEREERELSREREDLPSDDRELSREPVVDNQKNKLTLAWVASLLISSVLLYLFLFS